MNTNFDKNHMENYVENILAENLTLKRKLDSKCEAVVILNKELSECMTEKEQFRLLAEQLQKKLSSYKQAQSRQNCFTDNYEECYQIVHDTKESNRNLVFEVESLRQKLRDALGDIKALRSKVNHQKVPMDNAKTLIKQMDKEEELVKQLEALNIVKSQLEMDLQSLFDEKEELITERDAYKCKIHRLNHEFNMLLKGENRNIIDLDSLIMENRLLQEHLQQSQEEIKLASQTINRYKGLLENRRNKTSTKLDIDSLSEVLLSQKQVQDLIQIMSPSDQSPNSSSVTVSDLKSICIGLLENLNDKTLALVHQKKTNRVLASRIYDLEQRLEAVHGTRCVTFPSKVLLDGYVGSDVDKGCCNRELGNVEEVLKNGAVVTGSLSGAVKSTVSMEGTAQSSDTTLSADTEHVTK